MRVRCVRAFYPPGGGKVIQPGEEGDIPDAAARELVATGKAEYIGEAAAGAGPMTTQSGGESLVDGPKGKPADEGDAKAKPAAKGKGATK